MGALGHIGIRDTRSHRAARRLFRTAVGGALLLVLTASLSRAQSVEEGEIQQVYEQFSAAYDSLDAEGPLAYDVGYYKFEAFPKADEAFVSAGKFVTVLRKGDDGR